MVMVVIAMTVDLRADAGRAACDDLSLSEQGLALLMIWLSPSYPVGAFSYSSGIEWAVEAGDLMDSDSLRGWLETMLTAGIGSSDAILFVHAYRATQSQNEAALVEIAELSAAFQPSRERHLEATSQGRAFMEATRAAWPCDALDRLAAVWGGPYTYSVAVAVACAGHRIAMPHALSAYLNAVVANWVSAAIRLIPLGQTAGQNVLRELQPAIRRTTQAALAASLDDIGGATFRADLASLHHETQYTRLFRS